MKERKLAIASDDREGGLSPTTPFVMAGSGQPFGTHCPPLRLRRDAGRDEGTIGRAQLQEWGLNADEIELQERMQMGNMQVTRRTS